MKTKDLTNGKSVMRIVLMFSIFSSAFGIFLLYRLDNTIHGDLYNFGLQFDYNWALPTWTLERLLGIALILPIVMGAGGLVWDIRRSRNREPVVKQIEPKPQPQMRPLPQSTPQQPQQQQQPSQEPCINNGAKNRALRENSMIISCPRCKKMFGKPLVMLDFSDKKTQLVNVCPYCNAVLGKASEETKHDSTHVGILSPDEKTEKSTE